MNRTSVLAAALSLAFAGHASAYNIKHSYSAPGNATEYYGQCKNGDQLMIIENADGRFSYEGPAGQGTVANGNLDSAAKAACGE